MVNGFERWVDVMEQGKPLYGVVKDFPAVEREVLAKQKIESMLIAPIHVQNHWWGFIGFDECCFERIWEEPEIRALLAAANILGAAIYRKEVEIELLRLNNELETRINRRTQDLESEITERSQVEQMLRESEEKYRQIFENANEGIMLTVNGIIQFINPKLYEMTGFLPKESIGRPFVEFLDPDYKEFVLDNHWKRLKGEPVPERYDVQMHTKKGESKWFELKSNLIQWEYEPAVLTFLTDITERKKSANKLAELNRNLEQRVQDELKNLKQQQQLLIQKSKLESLGELSAGMAHEINQPLGSISMGLENLQLKILDDDYTEEYIEKKINSLFQDISRIRKIIEHIRTFSRDQQDEKLDKVSVHEVINNALSLITIQYRNHNINLSLELAAKECYTYGNKYKLEQVILNLLSNAKYAVDEKESTGNIKYYQKRITIRTKTHEKKIYASIEDNGIGIAKEVFDNIFDPFFTTKKSEAGTGLGLSIIYGIVKEMKGDINVDSEQGKFTRVTVVLPEYDDMEGIENE
jgi:PAS domain S-box-containing protein